MASTRRSSPMWYAVIAAMTLGLVRAQNSTDSTDFIALFSHFGPGCCNGPTIHSAYLNTPEFDRALIHEDQNMCAQICATEPGCKFYSFGWHTDGNGPFNYCATYTDCPLPLDNRPNGCGSSGDDGVQSYAYNARIGPTPPPVPPPPTLPTPPPSSAGTPPESEVCSQACFGGDGPCRLYNRYMTHASCVPVEFSGRCPAPTGGIAWVYCPASPAPPPQSGPGGEEKLSAGDDAGIAIGGFLLLIGAFVVFLFISNKETESPAKEDREEMLLDDVTP